MNNKESETKKMIVYWRMLNIKGKENVLADVASRMPLGEVTPPEGEVAFEVPHILPSGYVRAHNCAEVHLQLA